MFCHICRKEEFDFFRDLEKVIKGGTHTLASVPEDQFVFLRNYLFCSGTIFNSGAAILAKVMAFLERGVFVKEEKESPKAAPAPEGAASPYTDLTQDLGDRLIEYELVEDLIERGTLEENEDGTLSLRLQ